MKKLDMEKPYGVIRGPYMECPSAEYTQDGLLFDSYGEQVNAKKLRNERQDDARQKEHDDGQADGGKADDESADVGRHEHADTIPEEVAPSGNADGNNEKSVDDGAKTDVLVMDKTDEELDALAALGMTELKEYSHQFDITSNSKSTIIKRLKSLR